MSLSRVLIMDLFGRYPDAATIDEAVALHKHTLTEAVAAKQSELASAEQALLDFQTVTGSKADIVPAEPQEPAHVEVEFSTVHGHAMESRIRPGTELQEFLYSDYKYLGAARRLNVGVIEACGRRVWLTRREASLVRRSRKPASPPPESPEAQTAPARRRRSFVMRDERLRVGTAMVERRYRSGEYIAYADLKRIGTIQGDSVWLTDPEIAAVRKVCQERKRQRGGQ